MNKLVETAEPFAPLDDVFPQLVQCLMLDICAERHVPRRDFTREALVLMRALPWRENLGELREIARLMTTGQVGDIGLEELLKHVRVGGDVVPPNLVRHAERRAVAFRA